ncbi:uncharacterized protein YmfQ (DUF2313 family) [Pedobacter sp. AK013]|uniref:hypothetical protein n=1 Tax=Pedobacter sp. AK013 TaxID=2723071 RepID=UPI001618815B|nr:hypothetical protein [Pedobacter sp. AK013]MBB6236487.1 uncharacterized protein YmfQ (DUF2313 family) [Pedobacter sp. AK013]
MYQVTDRSTAHGFSTPHGFKTPHRYPVKTSTQKDLLNLTNQLYPTGRVWYLPENSNYRKLHEAVNLSLLRAIDAGYSVIDSTLPDNESFDEKDATLWEYRLGLVTNPSLTLAERMANIKRKQSFRGNVKARQHIGYIQSQLDAAGFNVKVYENVFYDGDGNKFYKTPQEIQTVQGQSTQHSDNTHHGSGTVHGGGSQAQVIANETFSETFSVGGLGNLWATFFIAGSTLNDTATVPESREREFRELVIKLKPAHTVAFIFINFN